MRIGTRASKLALIQAAEIKNLLLKHTSLNIDKIEIVAINTSGDKIQDRNLAEIGGKGLFVKELEESLISNKIDIAVHSAKDVPPIVHQSTKIIGFTARKDARDYFISQKYSSINNLPQGAKIGTSSARRKAILLQLRPDLNIVNFRGNVETRLRKLSEGEVDATILATCGLLRLEKQILPQNIIALETMLPAAGQGSLALQIRKNDEATKNFAQQICDYQSGLCIETERAFLRELGASCKTPVSAFCQILNEKLQLQTTIFDFDGKEFFSTKNIGNLDEGNALAHQAALQTKIDAKKLLEKICQI